LRLPTRQSRLSECHLASVRQFRKRTY
jgi:hypothetical protein